MYFKALYLDSTPLQAPAEGDAGYDLPLYSDVVLAPHVPTSVDTGIAVAIPHGSVGIVFGRSGNAFKRGLYVAHHGVIDSSYRGEIKVLLENRTSERMSLAHGTKIAQLVIFYNYTERLIEMKELPESERGSRGFGSTDFGTTTVPFSSDKFSLFLSETLSGGS